MERGSVGVYLVKLCKVLVCQSMASVGMYCSVKCRVGVGVQP